MANNYPETSTQRLLDLYPVKGLRAYWSNVNGMTKDALTVHLAKKEPFDVIGRFVFQFFDCCKQHVYVFKHGLSKQALKALPKDPLQLKKTDGASDKLGRLDLIRADQGGKEYLYLARQTYKVYLGQPLEEKQAHFLWPVKIGFYNGHVIVRLTKLSKSIGSYFDGRPLISSRRQFDKDDLVGLVASRLAQHAQLKRCDLHKGVKALWAKDYIDSPQAQYEESYGTTRHVLNEKLLIKRDLPEKYKEIVALPLLDVVFQVIDTTDELSVRYFRVNAAEGYLNFPVYTDEPGHADHVVRQIIDHN